VRVPRRLVRSAAGCLGGAVVVALLAACGTPDYTYVSNRQYSTIFKVPSDWNKVSEDELEKTVFGDDASASAQIAAERAWVVGFDAAPRPQVDHLFGSEASQPNAYVVVRELDPSTQGSMSLDGMRNLLLPVTAEARQEAAAGGVEAVGFELLVDDLLEEADGMRGVHVVYNYDLGGSLQTFDQTVFVDQATSRVHMLLVRCSATCYQDRSDELHEVATSFTVKS